MSKKTIDSAEDRLHLKQRELDLVLAIDRIRDATPDPSAMLTAIVGLLASHLKADLCWLCLADAETGEIELKVVNDKGEWLARLDPDVGRKLAHQAVEAEGVVILQGDDIPAALDVPQLATISVALGERRLGALLLARRQASFDQSDVALLQAAESQIDSAVIQAGAYYELQCRNRELETIYRIDHIRDQNLLFDEMLNAVLHELCAAIQSEMGFMMLYDRAGRRLELRASTHDDLFRVSAYHETIDQIANKSLQRGGLVCHNNLSDVLRSVMCIPLILQDEIIGVLGVVNRYGLDGFDGEDRRLLSAIASQIDTAVFESLERRRLRQVLGRSVDPQVMERLLANPDVEFLKGERSTISVLYADIRGSTRLAEQTPPDLLVGFINDYLSRMTEVILSNQGTLDKFVGDEVMALFGAPFPQPDHALRAVRVGLEMQEAHQAVMQAWRAQNVAAAPIGIGIATGELIVGEMGCAQRTDYTVIGRAANLGARICSAAKAGQVLISQATYDRVKDHVQATPVTGLQLKGIGDQMTAYHVTQVLK